MATDSSTPVPDSNSPTSPPAAEAVPASPPPARPRKPGVWVLAAGGLAALCILGFVAVQSLPRQSPPAPTAPATVPQPLDPPARLGRPVDPAALPTTYTVEAGDTFDDIAFDHDVPLDALLAVNDLADPDVLAIGQVLRVPGPATEVHDADSAATVRQLAQQYDYDATALAAVNGLPADRIDAPLGRDVIIVPADVPPAAASAPSAEPPQAAPPAAAEATVYMVADGDTLLSIADDFGVDPDDLIEANGIEDPDVLAVGDELQIPPPTP